MTSPQTTPEPAVFQVWPLARVLDEVRCGSEDWTWEEEWADLDLRHADTNYLVDLAEVIRRKGITRPVVIGSDGRLWDGHHRLRIAVRLGIEYVPVELAAFHADHRLALSEALGLGTGAPWGAIEERAAELTAAVLPAPANRAAEEETDVDVVASRATQVIVSMGAEVRALTSQRDRYRLAWQSARERAQAYGGGIFRHAADRDWWRQQAQQPETEAHRTLTEGIAEVPHAAEGPQAERCPGCGHDQHAGFCVTLQPTGVQGRPEECGCLDSRPVEGAQQSEVTSRLSAALCRSAEEDVTRVIELFERWVKAGPPPLGTSIARWWDARLAELHGVIAHLTDPQPTKETP